MYEDLLSRWIEADPLRMRALHLAFELDLPDWCIAAGFVRNLVWDKLHGFATPTPLADIDLVYFDPFQVGPVRDRELEAHLATVDPSLPWSVRNQARMHERNGDAPYVDTLDAMRHWVELETAVGVRLNAQKEIEIVSAFGLDTLFAKKLTPNRLRYKPAEFSARLNGKNWLWTWPQLQVDA
ncbi:MAG TPA: nucleotidyltransferase family protein [Noviherbaspirillum sp.]|jgi:hypothetical protein|uniref:nucleotidyltransferase family protein n=1 Tax=Noviherbaspirillum sp. TaxID=1926288 RepID=UPI002F91E77D